MMEAGDVDAEASLGIDEEIQHKLINEEYKTWKKNSPFLYDMILSTALEWPSLTTQWFPDFKEPPGKNYTIHRILIGTHTTHGYDNYLQIANIEIPKNAAPNPQDYDETKGEIGGYASNGEQAVIKMNIEQKIIHPGEVNKARYQPQNSNIIATMCNDGRVLIFDPHRAYIRSFALSWNPMEAGRLVTGSNDATVRLWDLHDVSATKNPKLKATRIYEHHTSVVNDVQYQPDHASIIGTVSDDLTLQILDTRIKAAGSVLSNKEGHTDAINALAFNHTSEYLLATASHDKTIGLWDMRNLSSKVHSLEGHIDAVTSLSWHPTEPAILGSGSYDRRIIFWDLSRIGEEQLPDDCEDGPPELLFMHGGHTNHLSDFSWNLNEPWLVCSAAEDNLIQIWKVAEAIVGRDIDDVLVEELEQ
ncbi:hypothetical protein EPUL_000603 [Erysiphe pulchra]|uniref:Histone-binding protein RBBP4-like N-terminal domain-containing protein n=1 Tax=Erysiphe pulchra TaxID=225359 RepID=A0A2S4Q1G9_9PEZI|nr:hypothetical protein EPUL_000603 [Erysiphe pulchra]